MRFWRCTGALPAPFRCAPSPHRPAGPGLVWWPARCCGQAVTRCRAEQPGPVMQQQKRWAGCCWQPQPWAAARALAVRHRCPRCPGPCASPALPPATACAPAPLSPAGTRPMPGNKNCGPNPAWAWWPGRCAGRWTPSGARCAPAWPAWPPAGPSFGRPRAVCWCRLALNRPQHQRRWPCRSCRPTPPGTPWCCQPPGRCGRRWQRQLMNTRSRRSNTPRPWWCCTRAGCRQSNPPCPPGSSPAIRGPASP